MSRQTRRPFLLFSSAAPPEAQSTFKFSITSSDVNDFPSTPNTTPTQAGTKARTLQLFNRQPGKDVVGDIRRLRRHHETTIFQLHMDSVPPPNSSEYKKLVALSNKLVEKASSGTPTSRSYALNQMISLAIEDPYIRLVLESLIPRSARTIISEPEVTPLFYRARVTVANSSSNIHSLWSSLLDFLNRDQSVESAPHTYNLDWARYWQSHLVQFKTSLSDPDMSFLAARFLCLALQTCETDNDLHCLSVLWSHYMDVAATNSGVVEWFTFDECINILHSADKPFISPIRLANLARSLLNEVSDLPNLFSAIFGFPRIDYELEGSDMDGEIDGRIVYTRIHGRNFVHLPSFVTEFSFGLYLEIQDILEKQYSVRDALKDTVLVSRKWYHYCRNVEKAFKTYSTGYALEAELDPSSLSDPPLHSTIYDPYESVERRALALFLLASFVGIDRYCKHSLWNPHALFEPMLIFSSLVNNVRELTGPFPSTGLPLFANVLYLRRFRLHRLGRIFITLDYLPEPPQTLIASSLDNKLHRFSVDSMVIDGNKVLWLSVKLKGLDWPLNLTGHYPILAGYGQDGTAFYVAAVKVEHVYHFTCVEDGARSARYTDETGDAYETMDFFVLALRYDPSDLTPPYPRIPAGAVDPTGPLYWVNFWPVKDADYRAASGAAKLDDSRLELILNAYGIDTALDELGADRM